MLWGLQCLLCVPILRRCGHKLVRMFNFLIFLFNLSPTTGCVAEVLAGPVGETFFVYTAIMNAICAFLYLLVWVVIKCKKGGKKFKILQKISNYFQ